MNIENLLRALRQAKKLRKALPFHQRTIYGIDVSTDEYPSVQVFIKNLFKSMKRAGFDIFINHWGEIVLTEPVYEIKVVVAVSYSLDDSVAKESIQKLENHHYLSIPEDSPIFPSLVCRFKLLRQGTKWHSFKLNEESMRGGILAENITEQIQVRSASLSRYVKRNFQETLDVVTIQDVLAVIRYGAAAFGTSSCLYSLSKDRHMFYPENIVFENTTIQLMSSHSMTHTYRLKPRELKLFQLLLPLSADDRTEIDR